MTESNIIIHQFCSTPGILTKIGLDISSVLLPSLITQLLVKPLAFVLNTQICSIRDMIYVVILINLINSIQSGQNIQSRPNHFV